MVFNTGVNVYPRENCSLNKCVNYHKVIKRRRNPKKFYDENEMCKETYRNEKFLNPKRGLYDDKCKYCHTKNELYFHPMRFRTNLCNRTPCPYGEYCPDIHKMKIEEYKDDECYKKLMKEYKELKKTLYKMEELENMANYWKCNKCKEYILLNLIYLKDCQHKMCIQCKDEESKTCSVCNIKISERISINLQGNKWDEVENIEISIESSNSFHTAKDEGEANMEIDENDKELKEEENGEGEN